MEHCRVYWLFNPNAVLVPWHRYGSGSANLWDFFLGVGAGVHRWRGVPGEPGIGPGAGEEWVPAVGYEGRGCCEGREGDGCKGFYPIWAQDLKESGVI